MKIHPVLLAGGSGTRLWPASRKSYPKQFLRLVGEKSLLQASARRLHAPDFEPPIVVTADPFRFIVVEQLAAEEVAPRSILIEPSVRNTAPAVLAATLLVYATDPEALLLISPSDHVIPDPEEFRSTIVAAVPKAAAGDIVTFGIKPSRTETGYGYLELAPGADPESTSPQALKAFFEKPETDHAACMVAEHRFLWNSGIFLARAATLLEAYEAHAADTLSHVRTAMNLAKSDLGFTRLDPDAWSLLKGVSIDYAIMEKADNLVVMPFGGHWSDIGSWDSVWQESFSDETGTALSENAIAIDCRETFLRSETCGQSIVGIGLEDIVAVAMPDAVLVMSKSQSQRVGEAVVALREIGAQQADTFPVDHRPWGNFERLAVGERFQVKRIVVKPGAALSLQSHHHRSEHWIVVQGTAKVTIGDNVRLVAENESVYVPLGAMHRLENPGKVDVVMIEVQTGAYLGEDDIVRYEDVYART